VLLFLNHNLQQPASTVLLHRKDGRGVPGIRVRYWHLTIYYIKNGSLNSKDCKAVVKTSQGVMNFSHSLSILTISRNVSAKSTDPNP
jgi:hypothetical protein